MKIYLFRHGETEWSVAGRHTGLTDLPLTEKGIAEAKCLRMGMQFDKVMTSPLKRAKETCILAGYEKEMIVEPALVEWNYGDYEGKTSKEIWEGNPGWTIFNQDPPNGEKAEEVGKRADLVISKCSQGVTAIFSSGHFLRVLAARWLGLAAADGRYLVLSTASRSLLGSEHKSPAILLWNDTSHLDKLG